MMTLTVQKKQETNEVPIYDILHQEIVELRLKPGAIMSIKDICEHYNEGRSPVREALIRLGQEGLITFLPQRGTMISKIDLSRVEDERFLRFSVEENVMQEFMASYSFAEINKLETLIWEQEACLSKGDFRKFLDADDAFHYVFYETTQREFCSGVLNRMSGHYRRVRLLTALDVKTSQKAIKQHGDMLTALKTRDVEKLQEVFRLHINRIGMQVHKLQDRYEDLFAKGKQKEEKPNSVEDDFLKSLF